jgi:hypothetical protein
MTCQLLDTPAEIRSKILKELLSHEYGALFIELKEPIVAGEEQIASPRLHLAILATCGQLNEEGAVILYSNRIRVHVAKWQEELMQKFKATIPARFNKLEFVVMLYRAFDAFQTLQVVLRLGTSFA